MYYGTAGEFNGWLRAYFRSPELAAKEMRSLVDTDKEQFYAHACRVIRNFQESAGSRFLASLMLERGLLLRALSEQGIVEQRVRDVVKALLEQDAENDLVLVRAVVEHAQSKQLPGACAGLLRVLNDLELLGDTRRIAPRLLPLLRHQDPRLRSKVVGIMGRCCRNKQWVARQLADPDPRTRANAVEGLWGLDDQESCDLLKSAATDLNNRVVGNALLGLYRAGDRSSITEILKMAEEGLPPFRATAAWVMGESGDPRFRGALKALADGRDSKIRNRASLSLQKMEAELAKPGLGVALRMAVWRDPPEHEGSPKRLRVTVQRPGGDEPSLILPIQFWIFEEDEQPMLDYSAEPQDVPDKLAMAILIPMMSDGLELPVAAGARSALEWNRPQDAWTIVRYLPPPRWNRRTTLIGEVIEIASPDDIAVPEYPPVFVADPESAARSLEQAPEDPAYRCIWDAIIETNRACAEAGSADVEPLLVIYCPGDAGAPPVDLSRQLAALDLTTPIHCIAQEDNPFLQELCVRSKGTYHLLASNDEVADTLEWLYVRRLARYSVTYQSVADDATSYIQVRTAEGWAKAQVQVGLG
jgi:hypothetical protein